MLERRGCLLPARLTHGPTLLGILTSTLMVLIYSQQFSQAQDTYSGMESYAIYPGWAGLSLEEGLLQLTFRTSNESGLLLYAEGNDGHGIDALMVMLEGGNISVMIQQHVEKRFGSMIIFLSETDQFYVGENLNDNRPHTLSLQRTPGQFTVSVLDRSVSESSRLLATSSSIGSMNISIGGLPDNFMPLFATSGHFRGCLGDVQFVNNSTNTSFLVSISPLQQQGVTEGCSDPCASILCGDGGGTCVALLPDRHFCDCSSTSFGGANCSEDLSMHRLNQTLDSYLCYALNNFPVTNSTGSVRLLAPLPPTGTIMTGVSRNNDQFGLYLDESILKLELISSNGSTVKLNMDQALNPSTSYQVSFEVGADTVELTLATISGSIIDSFNRPLTVPIATIFTTVCVGGTMLEIPYYVGQLEQAVYNAVPLSDRSFVQQYAKVETPVNLISFSEEFIDPPLTFQRFNFAKFQRITFEIRLRKDNSNFGTLILSRDDNSEIQVTIIESFLTIFGTPFFGVTCPSTPTVRENEWHQIDLTLIRNDDGTADLSTTVDGRSCNPLTDPQRMELNMALTSLINSNAPLQFGYTQRSIDSMNVVSVGTKFIGCLQNIEFRETPDSEPIRPDLASAIRSVERFGTGEECYICRTEKTKTCTTAGEMCADCGFSYPALCLNQSSSCPALPPIPSTPSSTTPSSTTTSTSQTSGPTPSPTPDTTDDSTTSTNPTSPPQTSTQLGIYIGIAVGGAVAVILSVIIFILLCCLCVRVRAGGQGFYKTEETNGKAASMLHYSASLRQIASEKITVAETNGVSPIHSDGLRVKEFYM